MNVKVAPMNVLRSPWAKKVFPKSMFTSDEKKKTSPVRKAHEGSKRDGSICLT